MKTYTLKRFRQNSYCLMNEVAKSGAPIKIAYHNKHHVNNTDVYLVNAKVIKEAQKYHDIKSIRKGLDNIAKHSKPMNEENFKHAIGL